MSVDLFNPKNVALFSIILDEEYNNRFTIIPRTVGYKSSEHVDYASTKAKKSFELNGFMHSGTIAILKDSLNFQ